MSAPPAGLAALETRPPKRAAPRFLGDDGSDGDEDSIDIPARLPRGMTRTTTADDVDRLFAELDNEGDDLDLPAPLRARNDTNVKDRTVLIDDNILGGASGRKPGEEGGPDDIVKPKRQIKPRAKVDEARLLGDRGFKKLRESLKSYNIKGKGHEEDDLRRLMTVYQLWTHHMFPRAPFRETLTLVEQKCKTKSMKFELKIWKDEAKGIFRPKPNEGTSDIDGENDNSINHGVIVRPYGAGDTSQPGSPQASQARPKKSYFDDIPTSSPGGGLERDTDMRSLAGSDDEGLNLAPLHSQASRGYSVGAEADIFFSDVRSSQAQPLPTASTSSRQRDFDDTEIGFDLDEDIEDDIDAEAELAMMEIENEHRASSARSTAAAVANTVSSKPAAINESDGFDFGDEEDILREMDALDAAPPSNFTSAPNAPLSVAASRTTSSLSSRPILDLDDERLLEDDEDFLKSIENIDAETLQAKSALTTSPVEAVTRTSSDATLVDEGDEDLYTKFVH